jgi:hypothetical protein
MRSRRVRWEAWRAAWLVVVHHGCWRAAGSWPRAHVRIRSTSCRLEMAIRVFCGADIDQRTEWGRELATTMQRGRLGHVDEWKKNLCTMAMVLTTTLI